MFKADSPSVFENPRIHPGNTCKNTTPPQNTNKNGKNIAGAKSVVSKDEHFVLYIKYELMDKYTKNTKENDIINWFFLLTYDKALLNEPTIINKTNDSNKYPYK